MSLNVELQTTVKARVHLSDSYDSGRNSASYIVCLLICIKDNELKNFKPVLFAVVGDILGPSRKKTNGQKRTAL